jgi:hypothetical protein
MKKDIAELRVEDLAIAIVPREDSIEENDLWDVYVINLREEKIENFLIIPGGFVQIMAQKINTTTLRYFYDEIAPLEIQKIEPIQSTLFNLTNEYWVSFSLNGHMFDKKYVFVKGSIDKINFTRIPFLDQRGVMIR